MTTIQFDPAIEAAADDIRRYKRTEANLLAQVLYTRGRGVLGVELFGSLSRGGGHMDSDLDIIVLVDGFLAALWLGDVGTRLGNEDIYGPAAIRQMVSLRYLGIDPTDLTAATKVPFKKRDIFLFPPNWRTLLRQLQALGHHTDPEFMNNIARDAITFVPNQGFPFPIYPRG